jgi:hypothetical protein
MMKLLMLRKRRGCTYSYRHGSGKYCAKTIVEVDNRGRRLWSRPANLFTSPYSWYSMIFVWPQSNGSTRSTRIPRLATAEISRSWCLLTTSLFEEFYIGQRKRRILKGNFIKFKLFTCGSIRKLKRKHSKQYLRRQLRIDSKTRSWLSLFLLS